MTKPSINSIRRKRIREQRMTTRHEFLAMLHEALHPQFYVETGVHTGESLKLASCSAWGIDPAPMLSRSMRANESVFSLESDVFFDQHKALPRPLDLGFIDGMHRFEYAWRDFWNMEARSHHLGVVAFDDVLPYTKFMASRDMVPGDWTGDVWKTYFLLNAARPDLEMTLVDTQPTGTLLVWGLDPGAQALHPGWRNPTWEDDEDPPDEILFRTQAVSAGDALKMLEDWRNGVRVQRMQER